VKQLGACEDEGEGEDQVDVRHVKKGVPALLVLSDRLQTIPDSCFITTHVLD